MTLVMKCLQKQGVIYVYVLCFITIKCRSNWQKVVAVALLTEHVISQIPPDLAMSTDKFTFLRRYNNVCVEKHCY